MMNKLCIFSDAGGKSAAIRRQLGGIFDLTFLDVENVRAADSQLPVLLDIDLSDGPHLLELKKWLSLKPKDGKVVCVTDKASHAQAIQALALGATNIVHRPLDAKTLVQKLLGDFDPPAADHVENSIKESPGVSAGFDALQEIFLRGGGGKP